MSDSQEKATSPTMGRSEAYLRRMCQKHGAPFTPALQQVAAQMDSRRDDEDEVPSLEQQFAQFGGLQAFMSKFSESNMLPMMTTSRVKKSAPSMATTTPREAALVQQMEATKAELAKAQTDLAAAKAETAAVQAKLEAAKRRPKSVSRIRGK